MRVMAQRLAIDREGHHIFLCCDQTKAKCCSKDDGLRSWDFLKKRLKVRAVWVGGTWVGCRL